MVFNRIPAPWILDAGFNGLHDCSHPVRSVSTEIQAYCARLWPVPLLLLLMGGASKAPTSELPCMSLKDNFQLRYVSQSITNPVGSYGPKLTQLLRWAALAQCLNRLKPFVRQGLH